jgi:hypothetical protein
MDLQSLTQLFATTYDSNPNTRKTGELAVRKVRARPRDGAHLSSRLVFCVVTTDPPLFSSRHSLPAKKA